MEAYYSNQATSPYFSGHYRQRGSGFGALAAGIGRAALPIARKLIWPMAKKIGRELLVQGAPEIVEVVTKKKSPKQAIKNTVKKTVKKQVVGSLGRRRILRRSSPRLMKVIKRKPVTTRNRSRSQFFSKTKKNY